MSSSEKRIDWSEAAVILLLLMGALALFPPVWGDSPSAARISMEESLTVKPIDLNTATLSQLMSLDGIGETKAKAILEYREANGAFRSVSEAALVKGISQTMTDNWVEKNLVICKEEIS